MCIVQCAKCNVHSTMCIVQCASARQTSSHIRRLTFQFVHCRSFRVRRRPCLFSPIFTSSHFLFTYLHPFSPFFTFFSLIFNYFHLFSPNFDPFSILPHSAPSWILSKAENLASSSLQDEATKWLYYLGVTTQPPTHRLIISLTLALCNT